jgi:hypothetical protein
MEKLHAPAKSIILSLFAKIPPCGMNSTASNMLTWVICEAAMADCGQFIDFEIRRGPIPHFKCDGVLACSNFIRCYENLGRL